MTKKKPRHVEPYTLNLAFSALGQFEDRLKAVVIEYFEDEKLWSDISERVHQAVNNFYLESRTNPDRKDTQRQRDDQRELIECLRELSIRMHPVLYIPLPLLNAARTTYKPHENGEKALDDELRSLFFRLNHIRTLFESIEIPTPTKTNPGKPEQSRLISNLAKIFDDVAKNDKSFQSTPAEDIAYERREFVEGVCRAFHLKIALPRKL